MQFGARFLAGALSGATLGASEATRVGGLLAGIVGTVIGTLGGLAIRGKLAASFGRDRPAAFLEDAIAIIGGVLIVAGHMSTLRIQPELPVFQGTAEDCWPEGAKMF